MLKQISLLITALFLLFSSVILSLPKDAFAGVIQLPQTGQTKCYRGVSPYDEIPCAGTGQDGEIRAGVPWPNPRFTAGTGAEADCITDNLTGLMWSKNGNLPNGTRTWQGALGYVAWLNSVEGLCGYTDWRLPNVNEIESLVHAGEASPAAWLNTQGFSNVQSYFYWSSTTYAGVTGSAWFVVMWNGVVNASYKTSSFYYVWPVRAGQNNNPDPTYPANVPKTGQTMGYAAAGDDGNLQRGVAWPSPRFTDNGNGTVTDNLTGLIWLKNANCTDTVGGINKGSGYLTWQNALTWTNNLASGYCGLTDGSQAGDWRLPNKKELRSLIDYSKYNPALPTGHPFISMAYTYCYWSSTTYAVDTVEAWGTYMWDGRVGPAGYKTFNYYVWPVRAGTVGSFDYYCDNDNDTYISSSISGTCTGTGCEPAGCQTTQGNDCNDSNASINPGATEIVNDGIDNDCNPATPVNTASGNGYNYPAAPGFRASLSLDVNASSLGTGYLKYSFKRMFLSSTSITGISATGGSATITGVGTVNSLSGYTFTATVTDSSPDAMGIEIRKPDGTLYYSAGSQAISSGSYSVVGQ